MFNANFVGQDSYFSSRVETFYDSCEFEWYVEYSCETPVSECPSNYVQVGEFGSHPDDTTVKDGQSKLSLFSAPVYR